jgi:Na+-driven multidrug efflux pump
MRLRRKRTGAPAGGEVAADDLLIDAPGPAIKRMAIPACIGFVLSMSFNAVDAVYASHYSTDGIASFSTAVPFYFAVLALGTGFGRATTALAGARLGAGEPDGAARTIFAACWVGAAAAGAVGAVAFIVAEPALGWLGGGATPHSDAVTYARTISLGAPAVIVPMCIAGGLIAQGDTLALRNVHALALALNVGLNPLAMYGVGPLPRLGVGGLAVTTVTIQIVAGVFLLRRLLRSQLGTHLRRMRRTVERSVASQVVTQGLPGVADQMAVAAGIAIITRSLAGIGPEAVSAYGLGSRIEQLVIVVGFGFNMGSMVLIGIAFGARDSGRVKQVIAWSSRTVLSLSVGLAAVVWVAATPLAGVLAPDPDLAEATATLLRLIVLGFPAHALGSLLSSSLVGLQRPSTALGLSAIRLVLAPAVALTAVRVAGGGFDASIAALAVSGVIPVAIAWRVVRSAVRDVSDPPDVLVPVATGGVPA